jgi:hypothetical protein
MIQLASDPQASRPAAWRSAAGEDKAQLLQARRAPSHPWPFISPHGEKPVAQQPAKDTQKD